MNPLKNFWKWMTNSSYKGKEREIVYPLKKKLVERDETIKILSKQVKTLEAQLSNIYAEKREKKEKEKVDKEKDKVAEYLFNQKEFLDEKRLGKACSILSLARKIYGIKVPKGSSEFEKRSKWGKLLKIEDKNGNTSYTFGDIKFYEKGLIAITDKDGNIRAISSSLNHVIKNGSVLTQLKNKRIIMAVDKNGEFIPEIDDVEIEVPVWNDRLGIYESSEVLKENARELIIKKDDELRESEEKREAQEIVIGKLKSENRELKMADKINQENLNNINASFSKAMEVSKEIGRNLSDMQQKATNLTEYKAMAEEKEIVYENIIKKLLNKLEIIGDYTEHDRVKSVLKDAMELTNSMNFNPELLKLLEERSKEKQKTIVPGQLPRG